MIKKPDSWARPLSMLVWDSESEPPECKENVVLWSYLGKVDNSFISIPRLVEDNAERLRARYLAWVYEVGEKHIRGRRLIDHLQLRPGFSYWWMTWLVYKSNTYASPWIVDAIKMLAFEEVVKEYAPVIIILVSNREPLVETFFLWCKRVGVSFERRRLEVTKTANSSWLKKLYSTLPFPLQALIFLCRDIRKRLPLRRSGSNRECKSSADITFCGFLFGLKKEALVGGKFRTGFWTALHDLVEKKELKVNWLHKYFKYSDVQDAYQARALIDQFNKNSPEKQFHLSEDGLLGLSLIKNVLLDYFRIVIKGLSLLHITDFFRPADSDVNFWPLLKLEWGTVFFGSAAMSNCLCLNLSESVLHSLPFQRLGFYLQENQPWERAYAYVWKAAGHGELVGVPHATARYWDLRYFFDGRAYQRSGRNDLPLPGKVAVNGPAAMTMYRDNGYPEDQLVAVEALRYLYLESCTPEEDHDTKTPSGALRLLVLGDFLPEHTSRQLQLLCDAAPLLPLDIRYTVKPHPACPVQPDDYPSLELNMTSASLAELFAENDVAYTSNITSAAVDAYCAGVPVISALEGGSLNMSPLRGLHGVRYVTGPGDLAEALCLVLRDEKADAKPYFFLDQTIPRWQKLLLT